MTSSRQGFSLVELSIVLVILGLLTGGILTGQSLIRASELRAVSTEFQRFQSAAQTFRDKYFAIPGDFKATTTGFAAATWVGQGNGNGQVEVDGTTATSNEVSLFWIHLSAAGMIEGNFTNAAGEAMVYGTGLPRSKLTNAGWAVKYIGPADAADANYFAGDYGNAFFFGSGGTNSTPTQAIKPEEAWNIDTKLDDGKPNVGGVRNLKTQDVAATGCSNTAGAYVLSNSAAACSLVFKSGF